MSHHLTPLQLLRDIQQRLLAAEHAALALISAGQRNEAPRPEQDATFRDGFADLLKARQEIGTRESDLLGTASDPAIREAASQLLAGFQAYGRKLLELRPYVHLFNWDDLLIAVVAELGAAWSEADIGRLLEQLPKGHRKH